MKTTNDMLALTSTERKKAFVETVLSTNTIWILTDEDGAVMLVTDDEDCIPVWPNEETAKLWKNAEWADCEPKAISLPDWHEKWTPGMQEDDLCVVIFPVPGEDGEVSFPDELESLLKQ